MRAPDTRLGLLFAVLAVAAAACLPAGTRGTGGPPVAGAAATPSPTLPVPIGPTPTPSFVPPTPTPAPTFFVYTVKAGDSLGSIANAYGTTARSIAFWNRSTYPSLDPESASYKPGLVKIGWTLLLLPGLVIDEDSGEAVYPSGAIPAP